MFGSDYWATLPDAGSPGPDGAHLAQSSALTSPGGSPSGASVLQPSTTHRDAQPSGRESSLHNGADYERSGQEPRRSPVRPISSDPDPKCNSDPEAGVLSQP